MSEAIAGQTVAGQAVAAARALEAEGRALDAIRLLTDANRAGPDPDIECALIPLRHDAFGAVPRTPSAAWRPITATSRASVTLPEITPDELNLATLREGLSQYGCVLIRGLVGPARVEELVDGIDRALAAFDANIAGASTEETAPWYVVFEPRPGPYKVIGRKNWIRASGSVWTADSPHMMFELCELVDELGLGELVTEFLGERPALSASKCTLRRVPIDSAAEWHQDGAFLGEQVHTLNFWLSLSHCGRDAPGLDIIPRRFDHVVETGTEGAIFDWAVSPAVVEQLARECPIVRPEFDPGDALLFDHLFLHKTAADLSMTNERYAIETWMFAPSTYPDGQIPLVF